MRHVTKKALPVQKQQKPAAKPSSKSPPKVAPSSRPKLAESAIARINADAAAEQAHVTCTGTITPADSVYVGKKATADKSNTADKPPPTAAAASHTPHLLQTDLPPAEEIVLMPRSALGSAGPYSERAPIHDTAAADAAAKAELLKLEAEHQLAPQQLELWASCSAARFNADLASRRACTDGTASRVAAVMARLPPPSRAVFDDVYGWGIGNGVWRQSDATPLMVEDWLGCNVGVGSGSSRLERFADLLETGESPSGSPS